MDVDDDDDDDDVQQKPAVVLDKLMTNRERTYYNLSEKMEHHYSIHYCSNSRMMLEQ